MLFVLIPFQDLASLPGTHKTGCTEFISRTVSREREETKEINFMLLCAFKWRIAASEAHVPLVPHHDNGSNIFDKENVPKYFCSSLGLLNQ